MDNRLTLALLIVLLGISSSHLVCSERFRIAASEKIQVPDPFADTLAGSVESGTLEADETNYGYQRVEIGSQILFKSTDGLLYTRHGLNNSLKAADKRTRKQKDSH
ncbi:MAG: hypothetical protein JW941_00695 [Candidatus Coatesbacteria bacterium]|nr:hypothetical protein [Candidatus Coatesbacteria bacterium]